jgi:hypothetical protein
MCAHGTSRTVVNEALMARAETGTIYLTLAGKWTFTATEVTTYCSSLDEAILAGNAWWLSDPETRALVLELPS